MTKEFDYWLREHFETVPGTEFKMARYISQDTVDGPRPESYFEDFELADKIAGKDADARAELYKEMKSGAESGWDYSTRWMITAKVVNPTAQYHIQIKIYCVLKSQGQNWRSWRYEDQPDNPGGPELLPPQERGFALRVPRKLRK